MVDAPDYRNQRSASPEGNGNARRSWEHYHDDLAAHDVEEAFSKHPTSSAKDLDPAARADLFDAVIEEAELLGFWLAWRRAGGFANLEHAGWNRATIFRKIRRFRTTFDVHPDDYQPEWIALDLHAVWGERIRRHLEADAHDEPAGL